jgi:hypothetical protein
LPERWRATILYWTLVCQRQLQSGAEATGGDAGNTMRGILVDSEPPSPLPSSSSYNQGSQESNFLSLIHFAAKPPWTFRLLFDTLPVLSSRHFRGWVVKRSFPTAHGVYVVSPE